METHGGVTALDNGALVHFNSVTTRTDLWKEILKTGVSIAYDPANLGAVGSSSTVINNINTKDLVIVKEVKNITTNKSFDFEINATYKEEKLNHTYQVINNYKWKKH